MENIAFTGKDLREYTLEMREKDYRTFTPNQFSSEEENNYYMAMRNALIETDKVDSSLSNVQYFEELRNIYDEYVGNATGSRLTEFYVTSNGNKSFTAPAYDDLIILGVDGFSVEGQVHITGDFSHVKYINLTNMGVLNDEDLNCLCNSCNPDNDVFVYPNYFEGVTNLGDDVKLTYCESVGGQSREVTTTIRKLREDLKSREKDYEELAAAKGAKLERENKGSMMSKGFVHGDEKRQNPEKGASAAISANVLGVNGSSKHHRCVK